MTRHSKVSDLFGTDPTVLFGDERVREAYANYTNRYPFNQGYGVDLSLQAVEPTRNDPTFLLGDTGFIDAYANFTNSYPFDDGHRVHPSFQGVEPTSNDFILMFEDERIREFLDFAGDGLLDQSTRAQLSGLANYLVTNYPSLYATIGAQSMVQYWLSEMVYRDINLQDCPECFCIWLITCPPSPCP